VVGEIEREREPGDAAADDKDIESIASAVHVPPRSRDKPALNRTGVSRARGTSRAFLHCLA
jgi:hypothetical protein